MNMYFSSKVKLFQQAVLEVYCTGGAWIWSNRLRGVVVSLQIVFLLGRRRAE